MKISKGLLFVSGAALLSMTGCVDQEKSLFDAAAVAAEYDSKFPVSDIDPNMDWKTTNSVSLTVAVEEDAGVDYTVRVFTENPLAENSSAKLLAEGTARKGQPLTRTVDVPKTLDGVYITRTDNHNRHLMIYAFVENNAISAGFGTSAYTSTRAGNVSYRTSTRAGETVTVPTLTPANSESEVNALLANATEYSDGADLRTGKLWKVSKGSSVKCTQNWLSGYAAEYYLLVAGTLELTEKDLFIGSAGGLNICVLNGGVLKFNGLKLGGDATINVYKGGTVTSDGTLNVGSCGVLGNDNLVYNAGTIRVNTFIGSGCNFYNESGAEITAEEFELNGGNDILVNRGVANIGNGSQKIKIVYNTGTLTADKFEASLYNSGTFTSATCGVNYNKDVTNDGTFTVEGIFHGDLVNNGKAVVGEVYMNDNNTLTNNCSFTCNGGFRGDITTAANTRTDILGDLYSGYNRNLAANSMIYVGGVANLNSSTFTGPQGDGEYALFKAKEISGFQIRNTGDYTPCHIYFETDNLSDTNSGSNTLTIGWLGKVGGAFALSENSNFVLPEGDCAGGGNTPKEEGDKDLTVYDQLNYTFVFEDNFPDAGDYDFNDAVVDVQKIPNFDSNNKLTSTDLKITLRAVGAIQNIGAAIRLVDFRKSDITAVTFTDPDGVRNTLTDSESQFSSVAMEDEDTPIIPLFGNAHAALGVGHVLVNTGISGNEAPAKSFTIHIASTKEITADNLDLFIANGKNVGKKRVEVHLYQFRDYGATALGDVCDDNLDVAGNKTWALEIPDFKYPQESVPIKNAYPNFVSWAQSRLNNAEANEDWYLYPTTKTDKVYLYQGK
jgi:LruC domain-containing protein